MSINHALRTSLDCSVIGRASYPKVVDGNRYCHRSCLADCPIHERVRSNEIQNPSSEGEFQLKRRPRTQIIATHVNENKGIPGHFSLKVTWYYLETMITRLTWFPVNATSQGKESAFQAATTSSNFIKSLDRPTLDHQLLTSPCRKSYIDVSRIIVRRQNRRARRATMVNTRKVSGRRKVRFESMAQLEAEIERLAMVEVTCLGNWSLGQILSHLARVMLVAVGETKVQPPLISRLIGCFFRPLLKKLLLETGMPAGLPHKGIPVVGRTQEASSQVADASITTEAGLAELKAAIDRYKSADGLCPHPLFGNSPEDWDRFNFRHAELHLSFVVPK